ncbi:MAG: gliding motility-associated C-terminal domain-containing protein [Flammeovirgaceae bacterium]|jgi:hypothetical protein|nr:gliding motility-associated C-terminal domain-containing protein [Flammeovirgaceae bacterium]
MKKIFLTLLLLISFPVMASHIVGGEFELVYISGNTYRLSVILYFDKINGTPGAKDQSILATIYRKKDNVLMASHILPILSDVEVPYSQPGCANTSLKTNRLFYSSNITLASEVYNDPDGYYVSWQRCCRNWQIDNVFSVNTVLNPNTTLFAGQTFYLEFPAVVKDGKPFINSSPRLFPPLSDYACPFRQFYVNFAGVDDDKDSLVYSLVTPLNTKSINSAPSAGPYPNVTWKPGFSLNSIMQGKPDLKISKEGILTVTPTLEGLFVFAVKVEEFRKGVKIGESRRDFQMLATESNACRASFPPVAMGTTNTPGDVTPRKKIELTYDVDDPAQNRCVRILVSDNTSTEANSNLEEKISIRAVPLNFKTDKLNEILPAITTDVVRNGSTREFVVCFPQCPYTNGPYQVGIIAFDDTCPQPLLDTLKITVNVTTQNRRARFISPTTKTISEIVREGETRSWNIEGIDADNDLLSLLYTTNGLKIDEYGFSLTPYTPQRGTIKTQLTWDPKCDMYPFFKQSNFKFRFVLDDTDLPCNVNPPDTLLFDLYFQEFPKNSTPTISTSGLGASSTARKISVERKIFEPLNFTVTGKDVENDFLVLSGKSLGFNMNDYGITFSTTTGNGNVTNNFNWSIKCDKLDLAKKNKYTFQFIVVDNLNKCLFYKADTVDVEVEISKPDNAKPLVTALTTGLQNVSNGNLNFILGEPIEINLLGSDADVIPTKDSLQLNLISATGDLKPEGYSFKNIKGISGLQSLFSWAPDCSIFKNSVYVNNYSFKFNIVDSRCQNAKGDTITVDMKISDVNGTDEKFKLPNVFTPNNDQYNDYFALEGIDPSPSEGIDLDALVNLPKDNCVNTFESVKIFNRWGDLVFESTDRKFRWYGNNESAGVYYYRVKYSNKEYKSPLSLRN